MLNVGRQGEGGTLASNTHDNTAILSKNQDAFRCKYITKCTLC